MYIKTSFLKEKKQNSVKADRDIFRRLIVAAKGVRQIDLNQILRHELTDVPYSLANADGSLRSTDKSVLSHILQGGYAVETLPASEGDSCCIIDGMA